MQTIQIRFKHEPEIAKRFGWSRAHQTCEMFVVGKWRTVGFYTPNQIARGKWEIEARLKLKLNARLTDVQFEQVPSNQ